MLRIAIYGRNITKENENTFLDLIHQLSQNNIEVFLHKKISQKISAHLPEKLSHGTFNDNNDVISKKINYLISIGGDGTLLDTTTIIRDSGIPIIGINTGRLGFLSSVSKEETSLVVQSIINQSFNIDKRELLHLDSSKPIFGNLNFGLNECTVHKTDTSSMITIHTYIDGELLNSYWSDGLIIATPTGSTAYSLSCGGPVIYPSSKTFVITPVAPHNLTVRPMIVPNDSTISLKIESRGGRFLCTLDSRYKTAETDIELTIRKADFAVNLFRLKEKSFFNTIRNKLMWGADQRN